MADRVPDLLLKDFHPEPMLRRPAHVPERAKFPVIDAHNHLFGALPPEEIVATMDAVGVRAFVNVSGNVSLPFDEKGYTIRRTDLGDFIDRYVAAYPGRFAALTMSEFARWDDFVLFRDNRFVDLAIQTLEADVARGARGLKITKELGLQFRDRDGAMIPVDDERLFPIWRRAGELGLPVLIHVSDPVAFFHPIDARNEHYLTLHEFPGWSFHGSFFSKEALLRQRDRMIARHPGTTFILPHVANNPEDLASVSALLDRYPNVNLDFSARIDELGRQPYSARDFMIAYQDRILFGTDMPVAPDMYRCYFRFLETRDESFDYPDYIGRWGRSRWKIHGLHLPDDVLRRIYYENAVRTIPGLDAG
ncbi:MAG: amidohydrolase family protein [Armatimonadetes bacterium]|nr:amidohydrolase family protein [Armatimonadota bacterium]